LHDPRTESLEDNDYPRKPIKSFLCSKEIKLMRMIAEMNALLHTASRLVR
jgi:hypothetical protein